MSGAIKIVRLKTGEDIVGTMFTEPVDNILIKEPMSVYINNRGQENTLVMDHWLPLQLIYKNEVTIKSCDVLTTFEPNKEFQEYYSNTVEKIKHLMEAKKQSDEMTDEEIDDIMDLLDGSEGQVLH